MTNIEIVKATPELLSKFYGKPPELTQKCVAAVRDGEVLGIAGIFQCNEVNVLFSEIRQDIEKDIMRYEYRKAFIKCMYEVIKYANSSRLPVLSVAKEGREISCRLLEKLGMTEVKPGVYQWKQQTI